MTNQHNLTIAAQIPGQKNLEPGIYQTTDQVLGFDPELGLIAFANSPLSTESSPAQTAMEILMDDMQTNIPKLNAQMSDADQTRLGANCLQESLDNINEYLYDLTASRFVTTQSTASITALHYMENQLNFITGSSEKCFLFKNNKLKSISNTVSRPLGGKPNYNSEVQHVAMSSGDILIIAATSDIKTIGEDFIRLTLSRFPDDLEMVLRQINTKISHTGASQIPSIIICRINQKATMKKKSWIGRLRNR